MAFLRAPSTEADMEKNQRSSSPKLRDRDVLDGHSLPGGSSLFREVMAELHPPSHPAPQSRSPAPRRRKSTQVKHVHYAVDGDKKKEDTSPQPQDKGKEEEQSHGPEKQILHGKCHCYFVENGNVIGLADQQCQHEHRLHPPQHSPTTSPHLSPRALTPEGSPAPRRKLHHQHSHPHHHHNHHHSSLQPPEAEDFRGRSHSDSTAMARVSSAKRTSLSPSSPTPSRSKPSASSHHHTSPSSPEKGRVSPMPRGLSPRQDHELHERPMSSLRITSPPPPILVHHPGGGTGSDAEATSGERRARKLSPHAVSSDQLHYLYDQFLAPGSGPASGQ